MKTIYHNAESRGYANHNWLQAKHSFSFAGFYDPDKIQFGTLRVLNDDIIAPGTGFGIHPHKNMEIITIPLKGALKHTDSMGHEEVIQSGEVQVMSAGTGIHHSEFNASHEEAINLLQLWILPNKNGHTPRYGQKQFDVVERKNKWQLLVSPDGQKNSLWVNQKTYISIIEASGKYEVNYQPYNQNNGIYFFVIEGELSFEKLKLNKRDAIGVWELNNLISFNSSVESLLLAIEVPMI